MVWLPLSLSVSPVLTTKLAGLVPIRLSTPASPADPPPTAPRSPITANENGDPGAAAVLSWGDGSEPRRSVTPSWIR